MTNTNPTTGIRYGVIAGNSLNPELFDELYFGGRDLTYEAAKAEAKAEAQLTAETMMEVWEEDAKIKAAELGGVIDIESFVESEIEAAWERMGYSDSDDYVEYTVEQDMEWFECDERTIEGEYEGVKYRISYLGGAPLLWVLEGPIGRAASLCSPCVPNAADLDSGFDEDEDDRSFECYVVPRDWLARRD